MIILDRARALAVVARHHATPAELLRDSLQRGAQLHLHRISRPVGRGKIEKRWIIPKTNSIKCGTGDCLRLRFHTTQTSAPSASPR